MKQYNYIYLITNQVNNKIYVGKHHTDNLDDGYMGSGKLIKKAIQKYGIENFTKEYLAFCDTEEKLNWFEKFYIKKYKARESGYNLTDGGDGMIGYKHTDEYKKHMSALMSTLHKGSGNPMYGKNAEDYMTLEAIKEKHRKLSESNKGKHFMTVERKQKISEMNKGKTSPMKGKHHTEEAKQKLSAANKGKHNHKGENNPFYSKEHSEETKQKISKSLYGKKRGPMLEETKQKIREAALKREAAKRQKNKENNL